MIALFPRKNPLLLLISLNSDISKLKIGIMANEGNEWSQDVKDNFHKIIDVLRGKGAQIIELDFSIHSIQSLFIILSQLLSVLLIFPGLMEFDMGYRIEDPKKIRRCLCRIEKQRFETK